MVQTLNSFVLKSLHKNDIPAISISPHSIVKLDSHKLLKIDYKHQYIRDIVQKKFSDGIKKQDSKQLKELPDILQDVRISDVT